jgi:hypothetical protein
MKTLNLIILAGVEHDAAFAAELLGSLDIAKNLSGLVRATF